MRVYMTVRRLQALDASALVRLTAAAVAGLAPYVYLPLSALLSTSSRYSWGDQTTVDGVLRHVLRADYGTFDLVSSCGTSWHPCKLAPA